MVSSDIMLIFLLFSKINPFFHFSDEIFNESYTKKFRDRCQEILVCLDDENGRNECRIWME